MAKHRTYVGPVVGMRGPLWNLSDDGARRIGRALGKPLSAQGRDALEQARYWAVVSRESEKHWPLAKPFELELQKIRVACSNLESLLRRLNTSRDPVLQSLRAHLQMELESAQAVLFKIDMIPFMLQDIGNAINRVSVNALEPSAVGAGKSHPIHRALILSLANIFESETGNAPTAYNSDARGGIFGNCIAYMREAFNVLDCGLDEMRSSKTFDRVVKEQLQARREYLERFKRNPQSIPWQSSDEVNN